MSKLAISMMLISFLALFSCGSSIMMQAPAELVPDDEYAVVNFLRPSAFGGAIRFGIWDSEQLVGILTYKSNLQYKAKPGEHLFLARAENWSYVKADLEAGKNYFIIARVFPGVWKARVAFDPVTKSDDTTVDQIREWMSSLKKITLIPSERDAYVKKRVDQVKAAIGEFKRGTVKFGTLARDDYR